jgi:integrase
MPDEIKVHVVRYPDCKNLILRYKDPLTGKYGRKSSGTASRKDARKAADVWQDELNSGRAVRCGRVSWEQFRLRYEDEVLPSLAEGTGDKVSTVFNAVEKALPRVADGKLADLTPEALSRFQAELREGGRSESTIASYLAHLRSALSWAVDQGMIPTMPKMKRPQRAKKRGRTSKAKGRPVTLEEFERMLSKIPSALADWRRRKREADRKTRRRKGLKPHKTKTDEIPVEVSPAAVESWRHYLRGLWLSGLRLDESLNLYWDRPDRIAIDLSEEFPLLHIPAELQKADRDTQTTIMPDFADFLLATPNGKRHGPVFSPMMATHRASYDQAGRMISLIGELAGVKVRTDPGIGKVKYASAHDLRRSFGTRWATVVSQNELQDLMRHADYHTTQAYYVDQRAADMARSIWRKAGADKGTVLGTVASQSDRSVVAAGDLSSDAVTGSEVGPVGIEPTTKGL